MTRRWSCVAFISWLAIAAARRVVLSRERVVFQLLQGDIEFAFYPEVAPLTAAHIFKLVQLGLYKSNHFFRIETSFVAQTSDVASGRLLPLDEKQQEHAYTTIPLEAKQGVCHVSGSLSLGHYSDSDFGSSSFSIMLGNAPHLDMQYTVFGEIVRGWDVLRKLETLPAGDDSFMMPLGRISILSTYWYIHSYPLSNLTIVKGQTPAVGLISNYCNQELDLVRERLASQEETLQSLRRALLP